MLNLLKRKDRYWIRREYIIRFVIVLVSFLAISLFILSATLFSFYSVVKIDVGVVEGDLNKVKSSNDNQQIDNLLDINNRIEQKISQFGTYQFNQTDIVNRLIEIENNIVGVESNLINISIKESEEGVYAEIQIQGLADMRDTLVNYQTAIDENSFFEYIQIPLSNFAKSTSISFTANLKTVDLNNYFEKNEQ